MNDPTLAIESAIAPTLRDSILHLHPGEQGATVADLLDIAREGDVGLAVTEPAWEEWGDEVVNLLAGTHALSSQVAHDLVGCAMLAFVLAGDEALAQAAVADLAGDAAVYMSDIA